MTNQTAQILASAINTTGSRVPPSSPSGVTHQQCILTAYRKAGLSPAEADYVELHATGEDSRYYAILHFLLVR